MPRPIIDRMLESYFFYFWNEDKGILQPKFIRQISGELAREIAHLRSQLGRLLTDKTGFFLQVLIEYNNTLCWNLISFIFGMKIRMKFVW